MSSENTLSLAVCDENGYELAFASTEGAATTGCREEKLLLLFVQL